MSLSPKVVKPSRAPTSLSPSESSSSPPNASAAQTLADMAPSSSVMASQCSFARLAPGVAAAAGSSTTSRPNSRENAAMARASTWSRPMRWRTDAGGTPSLHILR